MIATPKNKAINQLKNESLTLQEELSRVKGELEAVSLRTQVKPETKSNDFDILIRETDDNSFESLLNNLESKENSLLVDSNDIFSGPETDVHRSQYCDFKTLNHAL